MCSTNDHNSAPPSSTTAAEDATPSPTQTETETEIESKTETVTGTETESTIASETENDKDQEEQTETAAETEATMPARVRDPPDAVASRLAKVSVSTGSDDEHDRRHRDRRHPHHMSFVFAGMPCRCGTGDTVVVRRRGRWRHHSKDKTSTDGDRKGRHSPTSSKDGRNRRHDDSDRSSRSSHSSRSRSHHSSPSSRSSPLPAPHKQPRLKTIMKDPKKKRSNKNENIHFADYDCVFEIPHINDFPPEVVRDVYMSSSELTAIRRECIGTVKQMNDSDGNTEQYKEGQFLRGLDQHTLKYTERKKGIDRRVYEAVFRIQEFERKTGVDASEIMAKHCAINSEPSVAAAHIAAISDVFSSFKGTWSERSIPNPQACSANPTHQGTFD
eukprot:CAMPEP_0113498376 /NCGR_PEP_ID=MMETSP0014_2-20120614/31136_1 /TAXON_ID=2857 /ORGANISM="Nitzschia sp." /LENGTH=385 /DNA_ID=CAMNT_0000392389 /DNA_START=487 /DNA_END=1644 /DNA_ORIENTATION=- /assembly_acc=CAM_ASM_000159